jgi:hypothetical protein
MSDLVRNHRKLAALTSLATFFVLWSVLWSGSASVRGRLVARFDTARGHYEVLGYGLPVTWRTEYARLLRQRYAIEFRTVAFCTVSKSMVAYVDSYNGVIAEVVNRKSGHDVFKEWKTQERVGRTASKSVNK